MRPGWSDGRNEAWVFADVDRTATASLSLKGRAWQRPGDTLGLAAVLKALAVHQACLATGGTGILAGDGALTYGWEQAVETYYEWQVCKTIHATLDYQFVCDPAYDRARGPVSLFAAHWEF
ncbi:MAG TPA: carbohydrate porin [Verrucomicrobiae bacterium]|nr:carbohydrate porin [Verrucomicrobiae bacterium]